MTTRATPDIPERVSRLEGAYEQVTERLRDLAEALQGLRSEMRSEFGSIRTEMHNETGSIRGEMGALRSELSSLKTTIIIIGGAMWASTVGGFIALLVTN